MRGLEGVWRGENGEETTCIMTPIPNHLSTYRSLFYYSSFDEWGRVEMIRVMRSRAVWVRIEEKKKNTPNKYIRTDQGRRTC